MFAFFEENTLTNPDAVVYVFETLWNSDYPLLLNSRDIELDLKWEKDGEEVFRKLERSGFLNLDVGVDINDLVEMFRDKSIYLNRDLDPYCTIDFKVLMKESDKVYYSHLQLTDFGGDIDDYRFFLPEFLLDFGEYLEEEFTQFYISGYGILKYQHTDKNTIQWDLERLCGGYMILENLRRVIEEYRSPKLLASFSKHIKDVSEDIYENRIKSYTIRDEGIKGMEAFETLLKSFEADFHKKGSRELWLNYHTGSRVFEKNEVYQQYTVEIKLSKINPKEYFTDYFSYAADNELVKGSTRHETIVWHCVWKNAKYNRISCEVVTSTSIKLTFKIYLDFGT